MSKELQLPKNFIEISDDELTNIKAGVKASSAQSEMRLLKSLDKDINESSFAKRLENTLSELISDAFGEDNSDLNIYEYTIKQKALSVLNELKDYIPALEDLEKSKLK